MTRKGTDEWRKGVHERQRNVVFSDTAANKARFWRNIISSNRKLGLAQVVEVGLIAMALVIGL